MKGRLTCNIKKLVISLLMFLGFSGAAIALPQLLNDTINKYAKVNSLGVDNMIINDLTQISQFGAGDTVLLIQIQGVGIVTDQGSYGLAVQTKFGEPGGYEFLLIQSVNTGTRTITFTKFILNTYDPIGNVQLIKVPFYNAPVVNSTLHARPWSITSGTGGVLAMIVGRKLTLNAGIDVTGAGLIGAPGSDGIGDCYINPGNDQDSYPLSYNNAGIKGEGIAIHDQLGIPLYPDHAKGKGINFTGGGGGNGKYSGGGGGSNRGLGGDGGSEKIIGGCGIDAQPGGLGGTSIKGTVIEDGIFAGGGGGASTQATGSTASPGGDGGGIIIIVADSIDGNNNFLRADGETAQDAVSDAGAGGGGAGGSIVLSFQGFSSQLQVSVKGGDGGINPVGYGGGGGGSGGLIWVRSTSLPTEISENLSYGTPGPATPSEGNGEIKFSFGPRLNGFLFNSIWSAVTGTQIDSICSDTPFGQISGTQPVGGTPPFTYLWQSSTTSETGPWSDAPGVNSQQHYTPPSLLTQTTWFRRVVTDSDTPALVDNSNPVKVIVQPFIKDNVIGNPDTICYKQNPPQLNSLLAVKDGNGIYEYTWESSTDNVNFNFAASGTESYLPQPELTLTSWYRRKVTSGRCVNTSASVRINVLDTIENNIILTPEQEICDGQLFIDLSGTTPVTTPALSGGDNDYRFRWESSLDGSAWSTASGINNASDYNPDEAAPPFPGQQYFRRIVYSGTDDVCVNTSEPVLITEYPVITNNLITSGDQTICSGETPLQLTGSLPLNGKGAGSYTYTWQDLNKYHGWADIPGAIGVTNPDFSPPSLADTTLYRRVVYSSACSDISPSIAINVHKPIVNNIISLLSGGDTDTTICSGALPNLLKGAIPSGGTDLPGDYAYQWASSPDNTNWIDISAAGNGIDYQPPALEATTYYRRRVISGQCTDESGVIKITVLPLITNNTIAGDQTVCKDDMPAQLSQASGVVLSGGAGTGSYSYIWEESTDDVIWNPATGTNNAPNGTYQPPLMTMAMKYRRIVKSGDNDCCINTSNTLNIAMDTLPSDFTMNAGPDTSIFSFDRIIQMAAEPVWPGGSGKWTILEGTGNFIDDTENLTRVTGLSEGLNRFLWTVTIGACKRDDIVDVTVYEVFIPEGFSPNNDIYNNIFRISGLDLANQDAELTIVNGAGTEVYSTTNHNGNEWKDWDGTNSKGIDLPEGTYYYLLKLTSKWNGQVFKKSGFVILKRY